ncbi:MAG: PAS domain S-box protein [Cyanobacteria bacterium RM1_2_2]|nr:PAS domain S-box protein [Cyanobacteria bacterium RM1_2_2]
MPFSLSNDALKTAVDALSRASIGCVLVVEEQQLVGILTEGDVVRATAAELDFDALPVSALMSRQVPTCREAEAVNLLAVAQILQQQIWHLPVLDADNQIVGVITPDSMQAALKPMHLLTFKQVSEAMTTTVIHLSSTASLLQLAHLMAERQIGCVVISTDGQPQPDGTSAVFPIGVVTERDIVRLQALGLNFEETPAATVMSAPLLTVTPQDSLWDAEQKMQQFHIWRLVVIGQSGELQGILTQTDILRLLNPVGLYDRIDSLQHELHAKNRALQQQIEERTQLVQALAESKARYRSILNHLPDLVCCYKADGTITFANQSYCQYFNRPLERLLGTNFLTLIPEAHRQIPQEQIALLCQTKGSVTCEHQVIGADGQIRWMQWTDCALCDDAGNVLEFQSIGRDITAQVQAEATLRESEARYRAIVETQTELITRSTPDAVLLFVNEAVCRLFGWEREAFMGRRWTDFIHPDHHASTLQTFAHLTPEQPVAKTERQNWAKDGSLHWIEWIDQGIFDSQGTLIEVQSIGRNITERKWTEAALRKRETQLRLALEAGKIVCWESDLETQQITCIGRHTTDNQWQFETWQTTAEAAQARIHPDDRERVRQKLLTARVGQQFEDVHRLLFPDQSIIWVLVKGKPFTDEDGHFSRIIGISMNISERRQAEIALQASESRFRAIFEQATVGITQATLMGHYVQVNQRFCELLGYSSTELLGSMTMQTVTYPEDWAIDCEQTRLLLSGEMSSVSYEKRCICKNGELRWVHITGSFVKDELLQQQYFLNIIKDIHEYKQAEANLANQQVFLRNIIDAVSSAIFVKDWQGRFLMANQATADIYGVAVEEVIGKTDLDFNSNLAQVEEFLATNREVIQQRQIRVIPIQVINNFRNESRCYRVAISPFIDAEGQVQGIIGVASDITDLKQTEEELRQAKEAAEAANLAKSQFLANMSHELRTPLNAILGFAQLLNDENSLPSQREQLRIILRSGEHLLELINDVLEMSKIDAGRITLNETSFDLHQLLTSLQEMLDIKAAAKRLRLVFERLPNVPQYVRTDENKLRQVLLNLLGNAIKFTFAGTVKLRVSASPLFGNSDTILLNFAVEDTGPGIAASEIDSLFEPFVQTNTGQQSQEGTGLGLAISRRFVELMGGQIGVRSTQGQGATFEFYLPVSLTVTETQIRPISEPLIRSMAYPRSYRILVVEDQLTNRKLVVQLLSRQNFEVQEATNGEEALLLWEQWSPDLILMDMRMPTLDGYEATQQIRQREKNLVDQSRFMSECISEYMPDYKSQTSISPPTIIIALTASVFEAERSKIVAAGCDGYIPKPFRANDLLATIASHLGIHYTRPDAATGLLSVTSADIETAKSAQLLTAQDLGKLPVQWRAELHRAALRLDSEQCLELIQSMLLEDGYLSTQLRELVNEFRFDILINLTQQDEPI